MFSNEKQEGNTHISDTTQRIKTKRHSTDAAQRHHENCEEKRKELVTNHPQPRCLFIIFVG
jgi:hypothetical protein